MLLNAVGGPLARLGHSARLRRVIYRCMKQNEKLLHLIRRWDGIDYLWFRSFDVFLCSLFIFFALHSATSTGAGDVARHPCPTDFLPADFESILYFVFLSSFLMLFVPSQTKSSQKFSCPTTIKWGRTASYSFIANTHSEGRGPERCCEIGRCRLNGKWWSFFIISRTSIVEHLCVCDNPLVLISICTPPKEQQTIESTSKCRM